MCFFIVFFIPMYGSIKEYLADIFSVNDSNCDTFSWYSQDEKKIKESLCAFGLGLFKSISINDRFENKYDHYGFLTNIETIDKSIQLKKPDDSKSFLYRLSSLKWRQKATSNPLDTSDQKKIINIRKFLHLFCTINPLLSSEKIAEKLYLNQYHVFHNFYIKYALKIDLLSKIIDPKLHFVIDKSHLQFIDPFFKITTNEKEKNVDCIYDWTESNNVKWYEKNTEKPFNLLVTQLSPETDNSDILDTISNNRDNSEISIEMREEIHSFIQSFLTNIINIQKHIRKYNTICVFLKNENSCKTIQSYIRRFNETLKEKLNQEKIFKSNHYHKILPNDIWNNIISFCTPESLTNLMYVNKKLYNLITNNSDLIIQTAQKLDALIEFDFTPFKNENWTRLINLSNTDTKKQNIIFKEITDLFNKENKNKIKAIRMLISLMNSSKSSDETALELKLHNYYLFYNQYFTYALKAVAYINCFNTYSLKEYLKLWDKNFYLTISNEFIFEKYPENYNFFHMYSSNINNTENPTNIPISEKISDLDNIQMIRIRPSDFLNYLKKERNCLISDAFIEYFDNPTINTKNSLLEYEAQHQKSLITLQSYIRKHNTESFVLHYPNSILTIQSYIRKRACYHQLIELKIDKAAQTTQNYMRHLIAYYEDMNLPDAINAFNAIITIQKYGRKMNSEKLLEKLLEKLDNQKKLEKETLVAEQNRQKKILAEQNRQKKRLWRIKILLGAGLCIAFFALYTMIQSYKQPC